ncbi:MAG: pyridoxamine kinase [Ruminococcaceae bacterium]|nr:pyridoxamine kinase [Oscillospiraceae bacterium]
MKYNRVLTIQDISCLGQCSMTVALPILSACGQETCIIPSAVLSTHTGGFSFPTIRDTSMDIPAIRAHWEKEAVCFDAIYTGYLGTKEQIADVANVFDTMLRPGGKIIVDPAMADHGKLYSGFDMVYAQAMTELCKKADVILPNLTESCLMTGCEYKESYDEAYIHDVLKKLHDMGMKTVVLTGIGYVPGETGVVLSDGHGQWHYRHQKLARSYHGTGDIYASAFVGSWIGGKTMEEAVKIAADYACECIKATIGDESHWYGTKFESVLGKLIDMLK